jgi:hypothetical protein
MAYRLWSESDLAKLRSMAQKKSATQIAAELGRGVSAVAVKAHELGISLRVKPKRSSHQADPDQGAPGFDMTGP